MKLAGGTHSSYAKSDGSWEETTPDEIRKLIAALIYFGLVRVGTSIDQYWSTKTLFHGLWDGPLYPESGLDLLWLFACC